MRTTIEITDRQRAALLEVAAARGEKGFSALVQAAIDAYLERLAGREEAVEAALGCRGCLGADEADELAAISEGLRSSWR